MGWDTGLAWATNIVICFKLVGRFGWKFILSYGFGNSYPNNNYSILFLGDINSLSGDFSIKIYYINKNL